MTTPKMIDELMKFFGLLRPLQVKAARSLMGRTRGVVICPTGMGKTWVQVYTIMNVLKDLTQGRALISSHRLLLCEQLLSDVLKLAILMDMEFDVLTVASSGMDESDVALLEATIFEDLGILPGSDFLERHQVNRTTSTEKVALYTEESKARHRNLIIVSTYQSISKLDGVEVDIACMDEAHTTVGGPSPAEESINTNISELLQSGNIKRCFFFTATPVIGNNGRGMDNQGMYGDQGHEYRNPSQTPGPFLCEVSPKEAIDSGDILPPAVVSVNLTTGTPTMIEVIQVAFKALQDKVIEFGRGELGTILLVSVPGIGGPNSKKDGLVEIVTNLAFHQWATTAGVRVIGFTSSEGYYVNGMGGKGVGSKTRADAMAALKDIKDSDSAIILHYDILTEGIDLPMVCGVLPLRELCIIKFLQTLGRAARLQGKVKNPNDDRPLIYGDADRYRTKIDSNTQELLIETDSAGKSLLRKPVYWVFQNPLISDNAAKTNQELVDKIRSEFGVDPVVKNFVSHSITSTPKDAASVLPPRTKSEIAHAAIYTIEYEAMVFQQALAPVTSVLASEGASDEEKEAAAASITQSINDILDQLPSGETNGQPESTRQEAVVEEVPAEASTNQSEADSSGAAKASEQTPVSGTGYRRVRSASIHQRLGI